MTGLVATWQSLTAAQREAWANYAEQTPRTDSLGQPLVLTGQQQYVANNTPRLAAGLAVINTAPTVFTRGNPATSIGTWSLTGLPELDVSVASGASDDGDILLYVSRPLSPAVNFFKGPYRYASAVPIASGGTSSGFTGLVTDPYGAPYVAGEQRCVRLTIAYDDGRVSEAFEQITAVTA
jgi:hypothetical protein